MVFWLDWNCGLVLFILSCKHSNFSRMLFCLALCPLLVLVAVEMCPYKLWDDDQRST